MTPEEAVSATKDHLLDLGKGFLTDPVTYQRGEELGFKGLEFNIVGRLGVLGPVDADVAAAAGVFLHPGWLRPVWEAGLAVMPVERTLLHFADVFRDWGRSRYRDDADTARLGDLLEHMVDQADAFGRPVFAGWRQMPRCSDAPGRVSQALFVLREQRGAGHGLAVLASGLRPVEAMAARGEIGAFSAAYFGWPPPYPDGASLRARWEEAERLTDMLAAPAFSALEPAVRAELATLLRCAHRDALSTSTV